MLLDFYDQCLILFIGYVAFRGSCKTWHFFPFWVYMIYKKRKNLNFFTKI